MNAVLLAVVAFLGFETYTLWSGGREVAALEQGSDAPVAETTPKLPVEGSALKRPSTYEAIATENLFSEDRKEFIPEEETPPETSEKDSEPPAAPPVKLNRDIVLYGVVIMNDYKTALISNPEKKKEKTGNTITVKENDTVGGYTVKSIQRDRIQLAAENDLYEVMLFDDKKPPRETLERNLPKPGKPVGNGAQTATASGNVIVPQKPAGEAKAEGPSPGQPAGQQETEYINTPFGKIKRIK